MSIVVSSPGHIHGGQALDYLNALAWLAWTAFAFCSESEALFTPEIKFSRIGDIDQRTVTVDGEIATIEDKVHIPDAVNAQERRQGGNHS